MFSSPVSEPTVSKYALLCPCCTACSAAQHADTLRAHSTSLPGEAEIPRSDSRPSPRLLSPPRVSAMVTPAPDLAPAAANRPPPTRMLQARRPDVARADLDAGESAGESVLTGLLTCHCVSYTSAGASCTFARAHATSSDPALKSARMRKCTLKTQYNTFGKTLSSGSGSPAGARSHDHHRQPALDVTDGE